MRVEPIYLDWIRRRTLIHSHSQYAPTSPMPPLAPLAPTSPFYLIPIWRQEQLDLQRGGIPIEKIRIRHK